jgi:hypothetical protein
MWLGNIIYENREIEGELLELKAEADRLIYLGPNLTLRRCTVVIRAPASRLLISQTRFIDCTIEVKQELKNKSWACASLKGCRIKGRMTGCDFGPWRNSTEGWEHGAVEDCDFSEARLDGCRFHGCDPRTLRFPRWPCFTILEPIGRSQELLSVKWPGRSELLAKGLDTEPPSTVAVTDHAPSNAKRWGATEEELRAVLEKFDCIVM